MMITSMGFKGLINPSHFGQLSNGNRLDGRTYPHVPDFGNVLFSVVGNYFRNRQSAHPGLAGAHPGTGLRFELIRA
jgi:hypothetical protein